MRGLLKDKAARVVRENAVAATLRIAEDQSVREHLLNGLRDLLADEYAIVRGNTALATATIMKY